MTELAIVNRALLEQACNAQSASERTVALNELIAQANKQSGPLLIPDGMEVNVTERGFSKLVFADRYGEKCSLQKSSLMGEDAIWFGINDANPQIMASQAAEHGIGTTETTGWVPYPVPKDVLMSTRMHLTQDLVRQLLPFLHRFVETGEIDGQHDEADDVNCEGIPGSPVPEGSAVPLFDRHGKRYASLFDMDKVASDEDAALPALPERRELSDYHATPLQYCEDTGWNLYHDEMQRRYKAFKQSAQPPVAVATPSFGESDLNDWFLSLEPERQAILRDDKWMLANAAYRAGAERKASVVNADLLQLLRHVGEMAPTPGVICAPTYTNGLGMRANRLLASIKRATLYTCIGKGGEYELLGNAKGAGDSRGLVRTIYRSTQDGQMYFRLVDEFSERMAPIDDAEGAEGGRD